MAEIHIDVDPFAVDDRVDAHRRFPRPLALVKPPNAATRPTARVAAPAWRPKVAGCPAMIEFICESIRTEKSSGLKFEIACKASGFSTEQLWQIYDEWIAGRLHSLLVKETAAKPEKKKLDRGWRGDK